MKLEQIKETVKVVIGAIFAGLAIWNATLPVSEQIFTQLIELVFAIVGAIIGGPAMIRALLSKKLVDKP